LKLHGVEIGEEDFAEAFPMIAGRVLITAKDEKWALTAARSTTGFASSIILAPAEAGIEGATIPPEKTPDGRPGVIIQIYHRTGRELKNQMIKRISQCVLTCATACAFDAMPKAKKRIKVGYSIRTFGDGFERRDRLAGRRIWRIPVMEGEFIIEERFGVKRAIAGGNLILMATSQEAALEAAEKAVEAISRVKGVILPFPGGIIRSGSKVGSMKYKLGASTNHPYCPTLRNTLPDSRVLKGVESIYEVVFNGLTRRRIEKSTALGIRAAVEVPGVVKISAVNFGGRLGPYHINLKEALEKT
jgi:formylmethanofuran--tetrahydromethanopterin N-formyltransferase